jgi:hypothetical protein
MLNETDAHVLEQAAADTDFLARQQALLEDLESYLTEPRWYQTLANAPSRIAYFSPSSASARSCPSTPAASACSPATTSRRPATSVCPWSGSACSTAPATSASP